MSGNIIVAVTALLGLSLAGCSNSDALTSNQDSRPAEEAPTTMRLSSIEKEGRRALLKETEERRSAAEMERTAAAALADYLFDPASAQFRTLQRGKSGAICGKVNAKNRYGAYVGFKDFVVLKDGKTVQVSEHNNRLTSASYGSFVDAFLEACATPEEQAAHERAITSRYTNWSTSDLTSNLTIDDTESSDADPFAE